MRLWLKLAGKQTCRVLRHWAWLDFFGRVDLVEPVGELGLAFATMCWVQLCTRPAQHALGLEHVAIISVVFVRLFCCVCHRFAASFIMSDA